MNILYINTYYNGGGAEKVMRQLYRGVRSENVHTWCMVGRYQENVPTDVEMIYTSFIGRAMTTACGSLLQNTLLATPHAVQDIIRCIDENQIDIVHFHNIHSNYLGLWDIRRIQEHCPNIVFTLHDMWAITGGCAHAFDCYKWESDACTGCCGNDAMKSFAFAHRLYKEKCSALTNKGIQFVVPSKWLEQCCRQGMLRQEHVTQIYNGISLQQFREHNQEEMRRKYGLPLDKHVLLFAANGLHNVYKGFRYLAEALQQLPDKQDYTLAVVGNKEGETLDLPFETHSYGYVADEQTMSELYSAADLFLLPSVAESLSITSMESMASGTPVLAFATGGIPEVVSENVGWVVPNRDVSALAHAIESILNENNQAEYDRKRQACRTRVEQVFDEQIMLQQYMALYRTML